MSTVLLNELSCVYVNLVLNMTKSEYIYQIIIYNIIWIVVQTAAAVQYFMEEI